MSTIRVGPGGIPSRDSAEAAVELLVQRGYDACEIDFSDGFWMDWEYARRLGRLARDAGIALSIHGPLAAFLGHVDHGGRKHQMAVGMLDHTAAIAAVVGQLRELRERLAKKERVVDFGIEVMGRVQELGSLDDVVEISHQFDWVRPVIDFAHMHATSDGAFTTVDRFSEALRKADTALAPGLPFHIHFSDISFANRNEKAHLPYGEGTLRAEPLAQALAGFDRAATVISESPDEASSRAIKAILKSRTAPTAIA